MLFLFDDDCLPISSFSSLFLYADFHICNPTCFASCINYYIAFLVLVYLQFEFIIGTLLVNGVECCMKFIWLLVE